MANVDKAFGLRALGNLSATGSQKQFGYNIADNQSGAIFQGQLVTLKDGFILAFDPSSHTAAVGVFNGCNYIDPTTGKPTFSNFYPGSINITQGEIIALTPFLVMPAPCLVERKLPDFTEVLMPIPFGLEGIIYIERCHRQHNKK